MESKPKVDAIADSPLIFLEGNILWQFENLSEFGAKKLKMQVADGILSGEIELDLSSVSPKGPWITQRLADVPEIHVYLSHLEMLWAFIYGWMVVYEECVQEAQLNPTEQLDDKTEALIDRAQELLKWSGSLSETYTPWPVDLPSPKNFASAQEEWYGLKANLVFQKAVAYLLCHERAHAVFGHLNANPSIAGNQLLLDMEKEADLAAFNDLIESSLDDHEKSSEAWAMLSVLLSSFYLCKDPRDALHSRGHPALHHRLSYMIERLAFSNPNYDYYFVFLCRLVLRNVFPEVLNSTRQFDDWRDALTDAFDALDQIVLAP
jgi:hypothetical protein